MGSRVLDHSSESTGASVRIFGVVGVQHELHLQHHSSEQHHATLTVTYVARLSNHQKNNNIDSKDSKWIPLNSKCFSSPVETQAEVHAKSSHDSGLERGQCQVSERVRDLVNRVKHKRVYPISLVNEFEGDEPPSAEVLSKSQETIAKLLHGSWL